MSNIDPFTAFFNARHERNKAQFQAYNTQEVAHIGGRYALEREQMRGYVSQEVERMRQAGQHDMQSRQHSHDLNLKEKDYFYKNQMHLESLKTQLQIEEKKGILTQWVERFRGNTAKELESLRQKGATQLQDAEIQNRVFMLEMEQAEDRFRMDKAFAHELELNQQFEQLERFKIQCSQIYALEEQRFSAMVEERKNLHSQLLKEFDTQATLGKSTNENLSELLKIRQSEHEKMNSQFLEIASRVALAKMTRSDEKRSEQDEVDRLSRQWSD
jgi:hypothetical protein